MDDALLEASKAAELWLASIHQIADLGRRSQILPAYELLEHLARDYGKHSTVLIEANEAFGRVSDEPIKWASGRGLTGVCAGPGVLPHVWSSAHEASLGLASVVLTVLLDPILDIESEEEQNALAERLLTAHWKALSISIEEVAEWQERIRRERAKYQSNGAIGVPKSIDGRLSRESLTSKEHQVLLALHDGKQLLIGLEDLAPKAQLSRKVCGEIVNDLIKRGFASRPKGPRRGVAITPEGEALLKTR